MKFNEAWSQLMRGKTIESCETGYIYEPVFDINDKEDIIDIKVAGELKGFSNEFISLMEITGDWNILI